MIHIKYDGEDVSFCGAEFPKDSPVEVTEEDVTIDCSACIKKLPLSFYLQTPIKELTI